LKEYQWNLQRQASKWTYSPLPFSIVA
jgi:hypothetical protein